jgi:hypothetical protein
MRGREEGRMRGRGRERKVGAEMERGKLRRGLRDTQKFYSEMSRTPKHLSPC